MARIDAIINDTVAKDFRIHVIQRIGVKKGSFSKALEDAMKSWSRTDVVEQLKKGIISYSITNVGAAKNLVDALKEQGDASLPALFQISEEIIDAEISNHISLAIKDLASRH